ncbi:MAG: hypothetical protein HKN14_16500 [Marinicaulis sp.]|nr:hypothetical protein [Marinicaulis sp.]NNE42509.1 hypothetical protein [Marinicaulis sp.]
MTAATVDATTRVQSLMEITRSLSNIFAQENKILRNGRPAGIAPLQAEKARLAAVYAQSIRDIAANRNSVEGAEPALLTELKAITQIFEARAERQRGLLAGASQASEGVVRAVAEEASAAKGAGNYSREESIGKIPAPISIDESA